MISLLPCPPFKIHHFITTSLFHSQLKVRSAKFNDDLKWGMKFYENYEVYKKTSNFISHLKDSVRKWTGDEKKTRKQAGERVWKRFRQMARGLSPPQTKIFGYVTAWETRGQSRNHSASQWFLLAEVIIFVCFWWQEGDPLHKNLCYFILHIFTITTPCKEVPFVKFCIVFELVYCLLNVQYVCNVDGKCV